MSESRRRPSITSNTSGGGDKDDSSPSSPRRSINGNNSSSNHHPHHRNSMNSKGSSSPSDSSSAKNPVEEIRAVLMVMFRFVSAVGQHNEKKKMKAFYRWKFGVDVLKENDTYRKKLALNAEIFQNEKIAAEERTNVVENEAESSNDAKEDSKDDLREVTDFDYSSDSKTLDLWTNYQRLSDSYHDLKKSSLAKENQLRRGGLVFVIVSLLRSRLKLKLSRSFSLWHSVIQIKAHEKIMQNQKMKLDVGIKHVESKQRSVKKVENENINLQKNLLFLQMFTKWKLNNLTMKLAQERQTYESQRTRIMSEVMHLKEVIRKNAQNEAMLLQISKEKGIKYQSEMEKLRVTLVDAYAALNKQREMAADLRR